MEKEIERGRLKVVAGVLKKRFNNLSVEETIDLASAVIDAEDAFYKQRAEEIKAKWRGNQAANAAVPFSKPEQVPPCAEG